MSSAPNLERLPRIPKKSEGCSKLVLATVEGLKERMVAGTLNLYQRGWLAQFDEEHGDGEIKARLVEEITTTTTTQRREIEMSKPSPEAETQRYEGQRLDRVLGVISEVQRESTRTLRTVLEEIKTERGEMKAEREEQRQFQRQLFMDQRSLLELAFGQLKQAHQTSVEAMTTLREGIQAKGEAEAVGIAVQAQANAAAQAAQAQSATVKDGIRERLEDTLLVGIANKMGLEIPLPAKPATVQPAQAPGAATK